MATSFVVYTTVRNPKNYAGNAILIEPDWFTLRSPAVRNVESAFRARDLCRHRVVVRDNGATQADRRSAPTHPVQFVCHLLISRQLRLERAGLLRPAIAFPVRFCHRIFRADLRENGLFLRNGGVVHSGDVVFKADLAILSVFKLNDIVDVLAKNYGALGGLREIQAGGARSFRTCCCNLTRLRILQDRKHLRLDQGRNGRRCAGRTARRRPWRRRGRFCRALGFGGGL